MGRLVTLAAVSVVVSSVVETQLAGQVFAGNAAQGHGPNLGLAIMRSGDDPRAVIPPGGTVTVSVGVNNMRGDADARSSVLTVILPNGLKFKQARPPADRTEAAKTGTEVVWNLGAVPAKAFPRIFELDITAGEISSNTALVVATITTTDGDSNQKKRSATLVLRVRPAAADLVVRSSLEAVPLTIGGPVKFTAEVSNWGSVSASGSALSLTVPPKVLFQSSDPAPTGTTANVVKWQLGDIEPAGSRSVTVTIALDMSLAASIGDTAPVSLLKFIFDASTTTTDINPANNHIEIEKPVEVAGFDLQTWLDIEGTELGPLPIGKDVTYAITYGNFGNAPAAKASVSLSLGDGFNFVSAEPRSTRSSKSDRFGGGMVTWDVGDLRVGESSLIKCRVHVASVPDYGSLVMANITAPGTDINPANNSAFFYGYPPTTAEGGALRKALVNRQAGRTAVVLRWLLVLAFIAAVWLLVRKMRRGGLTQ